MLDLTAPKGRIISAALDLAAQRPWRDVTILDIAEAAGLDLPAMRQEFPSKNAILSAFARAVDDVVMTKVPPRTPGQSPRDRVFDVIMARFDALTPYKTALKSIAAARPFDGELARRAMSSSAWMLHTAGVPTDGAAGLARVTGLAAIYQRVLQTWLEDDDPGMGRTMATLDRQLKRGEETLRLMSGTMSAVEGLAKSVSDALSTVFGTNRARPTSGPAAPNDGAQL